MKKIIVFIMVAIVIFLVWAVGVEGALIVLTPFVLIGLIILLFKLSFKEANQIVKKFEDELEELKQDGFNIDKKIDFKDSLFNMRSLYIDNNSKRFAIADGDKGTIDVYNFDELYEIELCENGETITKGRAGSALVGNAIFGLPGAIIGASRSKKNKGISNSIDIRIRINKFDTPEIKINISNKPLRKDSDKYKVVFEKTKEIMAMLSYIQNDTNNKQSEIVADHITSKLKQLSLLKDEEVITVEEFEQKKKEILEKI